MYKNILMSVDLDQQSSWQDALPAAIDLCRCNKANLHVLTVVPDFGMSIVNQYFPDGFKKEAMQKVLSELRKFVKKQVPKDIKVQHIVGEGTVYEVILKIARQVKSEVIVMASQRPELKDYLLGPNASRVVRHAECSVLVVRKCPH